MLVAHSNKLGVVIEKIKLISVRILFLLKSILNIDEQQQ